MGYDVAIVGSGILGVFHAHFAALKGKRVLLLEKDQQPRQATVRNFGQVVPSGMSEEWFPHALRGLQVYSEIQSQMDVSIRNNGSVYVASDEDEQQLIHELAALMRSRNYPFELLTQEQCIKKWPSLKKGYCKEAIFFPLELSAEPELLIHRLIDYCKTKHPNLTFRPSTPIIACDAVGGKVRLTTASNEKIETQKVIICNGGEYKLLFPEMFAKSGIVISKLQMMKTIPMPSIQLEGNILTGLTIRRYESFQELPSFRNLKTPDHLAELKKWGIHILFKKGIDGSIIIGDSHEYASVNSSDELGFHQNEYINELMLAEAERIVDFDVRKLAYTWSGFYPQHPHRGIVEMDIENNIHIRTAIGGKGMTSSAGYAEASVKKIFDL